MAQLLSVPSKNGVQKTLASQLLSTAGNGDPISFDDVDGIANSPGILVINRVDANGETTPAKREYIEYSGTSGNTVIITTRNVDGSNSALTHAVGSIVEFVPDVVWAQRIYDALSTLVDPDDTDVLNSNIVTADGTQTITGDKTLSGTNTFTALLELKRRKDTVYANGNLGATPAIDIENGTTQSGTLSANATMSFSNFTAGDYLTLILSQDGTGNKTLDFSGSVSIDTNIADTPNDIEIPTTASSEFLLGIRGVGSDEVAIVALTGALATN